MEEGILLKMKKGLTGSTYWKPHWIFASLDRDEFLQFNSSSRPIMDFDEENGFVFNRYLALS